MAQLGDRSIRRLSQVVRKVERGDRAPASSARDPVNYNTIVARITGHNGAITGAKYSWEQVRISSSGSYEAAGLTGTTTTGYAMALTCLVDTGDVVGLVRMPVNNGDGTFSLAWQATGPGLGVPRLVTLTQNGGSDGSKTALPTYTYNVKLGSRTLLTAAAPAVRRYAAGRFAVATSGLAYMSAANTYVLLEAFEQKRTNGC